MNAILDALLSRRSIRSYDDRPVPEETLIACLTAATWAPSAHNAQPWRFVVVEGETRAKLARAMARAFDEDMKLDGVPEATRRLATARSIERFATSPVVIVGCIDMSDMDVYPDARRRQVERVLAVQSLSCALQNFLIAAHSLGLGACWFCAPAFCPQVVHEALGLAESLEPLALVTAGYAREVPARIPERKALQEIVLRR